MKRVVGVLRRGRERAGLTQAELGRMLGCARDTIIRIENGRQNITVEQVVGYVKYCNIKLEEILQAFEPEKPSEFAYMLRMHDTHYITPEVKEQFEAWYINCERKTAKQPPLIIRELPHFRQDENKDARIQGENAANKTRQLWNLGTAPIDNPVELIENLGIFIQSADLGANDLYALTGKRVDTNQYGMIINTNDTVTIERQRFSIIHELAHIIAHRDEFCTDCTETGRGRSKNPKEIYADAFAGAFLVPANELQRLIQIVKDKSMTDSGTLILQLKRYFGVSYLTVLLRLKSINYFATDRQFGIAYGRLKKLFGTTEPQPITTLLEFHNSDVFGLIEWMKK